MKRVNLNHQSNRNRSGFTLLELLMVIAIIGIVASLLTAGIMVVFGSAQEAQVSAEITQLDQAIVSFKNQFGIEPPSNLLIPPVAASGGVWDTKSRAAVRALWPQFDFATNGGMGNTGPIHLNGAECLVFFLGGMPSPTGTVSGFSKNPRTPWTFATGNTDGPYFDFDVGRLVDVDAGVDFAPFPEYIDPLPDQTTPYLYLTGQGKNYNKVNDPANPDDYDVFNDPLRDLYTCYRQADWNKPQRADGFQLISPGVDGQYGPGGLYTDGSELPERDLDGNTTIEPWERRKAEEDNITNFSNGRLRP